MVISGVVKCLKAYFAYFIFVSFKFHEEEPFGVFERLVGVDFVQCFCCAFAYGLCVSAAVESVLFCLVFRIAPLTDG